MDEQKTTTPARGLWTDEIGAAVLTNLGSLSHCVLGTSQPREGAMRRVSGGLGEKSLVLDRKFWSVSCAPSSWRGSVGSGRARGARSPPAAHHERRGSSPTSSSPRAGRFPVTAQRTIDQSPQSHREACGIDGTPRAGSAAGTRLRA